MLTYFASQYRRLKAYLERRAENKLWDQRRAKALAIFEADQRSWAEQVLKNQEAFQRSRFTIGMATVYASPTEANETATQKTARIKFDDIVYRTAAAALKKLDVFRQVIGIQPMNGPCGLVFRMCPQYELKQEDGEERKIGIKVSKVAVEASTKKLALRLNHMALSVADSSVLPLDELIDALATEVALEIAAAIIQNLKVIGGKQNAMDRAFKEERIGDKVIIAINTIANKVSTSSRRGPANFVICGPSGLLKLQSAGAPRFTSTATYAPNDMLKHVGYINDVIKVYASSVIDDASFIVGFNGASATDSGYIFAPYVPLMATGPLTDPETYDIVTSFATRYGVSLIPESADMPVDSSSYYGVLRLKEAV